MLISDNVMPAIKDRESKGRERCFFIWKSDQILSLDLNVVFHLVGGVYLYFVTLCSLIIYVHICDI